MISSAQAAKQQRLGPQAVQFKQIGEAKAAIRAALHDLSKQIKPQPQGSQPILMNQLKTMKLESSRDI